ncbi:glycosyltransferase family 2 protein [Bradyrhizobium archetypum]|uniref:Glycosyltransferase n=1 Tax=Bradyrhizobium archetypum TaxID=2721160 RepID=A0A7Y4M2D0_9BRAD|nr:glycosyltransferase [Bradyrhizobium archetypum]NOJ47687.1 glycosyltransferase [Bradyrhizobium archetypum]
MVSVSCVLPVFNGANFLGEAIRSVLDQTFSDFELIVVDDGSTDNSAEIAASFQDSRITILKRTNAGIVAALNAGLQVARGKYIARMDADDISVPNRFEKQVEYLELHPACVLVGGLAQGFDEQGKEGFTTGGRHTQTDLSCFPPKVAVSLHPLIMIRADILRSIGGYRAHFKHAEDYDLYLRLAIYGSIDNPSELMLFYRRHASAMSIQNLAEQERNAALSEAIAIAELRHGSVLLEDVEGTARAVWPASLFEPYVRFRIWRRNLVAGGEINWRVFLGVVLNLSPGTIFSSSYFGLRVRACGSLIKLLVGRYKVQLQKGRGRRPS